jgi:hypothetical protein
VTEKGDNHMMNALHLLWIIPLSASFGFMIAAILAAAKD